jgi:hypothetical protein
MYFNPLPCFSVWHGTIWWQVYSYCNILRPLTSHILGIKIKSIYQFLSVLNRQISKEKHRPIQYLIQTWPWRQHLSCVWFLWFCWSPSSRRQTVWVWPWPVMDKGCAARSVALCILWRYALALALARTRKLSTSWNLVTPNRKQRKRWQKVKDLMHNVLCLKLKTSKSQLIQC